MASVAPYDGSSTESECYDEELLELATDCASPAESQPPVKTEATVDVKVEIPHSNAAESSDTKTKATYAKCNRCRRKLPEVTQQEQLELQQGKLRSKRCACCCEDLPLGKFGRSSRSAQCAIPRCRSCSQAPLKILQQLKKDPRYAEAVAIERQTRNAEQKEKRAKLPTFERKSAKKRWDEQFELVKGKTARERRVEKREAERKSRLARIRGQQQNK